MYAPTTKRKVYLVPDFNWQFPNQEMKSQHLAIPKKSIAKQCEPIKMYNVRYESLKDLSMVLNNAIRTILGIKQKERTPTTSVKPKEATPQRHLDVIAIPNVEVPQQSFRRYQG